MGFTSLTWPLPSAREAGADTSACERAVALALDRRGALGTTSVLFVDPGPAEAAALRRVRDEGARVTALCAVGRELEARAAGAEFVIDSRRTDPTWYRGAWSVIVDPAGRLGFRRAQASLSPRGVYLTVSPRLGDRARSLLSRLGRGPRVQRIGR